MKIKWSAKFIDGLQVSPLLGLYSISL